MQWRDDITLSSVRSVITSRLGAPLNLGRECSLTLRSKVRFRGKSSHAADVTAIDLPLRTQDWAGTNEAMGANFR
jgi:hypothetical protein